MDNSRLTLMSNDIHACGDIEELTLITKIIGKEVLTFDVGEIEWLLSAVDSSTWRIENPGVSDEEWNKIMRKVEKDGFYTNREEHEKSNRKNRRSWKSVRPSEGYKLPTSRTAQSRVGKSDVNNRG